MKFDKAIAIELLIAAVCLGALVYVLTRAVSPSVENAYQNTEIVE